MREASVPAELLLGAALEDALLPASVFTKVGALRKEVRRLLLPRMFDRKAGLGLKGLTALLVVCAPGAVGAGAQA